MARRWDAFKRRPPFAPAGERERAPGAPPGGGAGHPLPLWLEEASRLGSGGIFGRGTGGESGLVATSLFRVNARPSKPIVIKIAPPIISQCGNSIDESKPIYFPLAFSPLHLDLEHTATLIAGCVLCPQKKPSLLDPVAAFCCTPSPVTVFPPVILCALFLKSEQY